MVDGVECPKNKCRRTLNSPKTTAHSRSKFAKIAMAPPNIPTFMLEAAPLEEKHGAMYTPRSDVNPTIAVDPYKHSATDKLMVYRATKVMAGDVVDAMSGYN